MQEGEDPAEGVPDDDVGSLDSSGLQQGVEVGDDRSAGAGRGRGDDVATGPLVLVRRRRLDSTPVVLHRCDVGAGTVVGAHAGERRDPGEGDLPDVGGIPQTPRAARRSDCRCRGTPGRASARRRCRPASRCPPGPGSARRSSQARRSPPAPPCRRRHRLRGPRGTTARRYGSRICSAQWLLIVGVMALDAGPRRGESRTRRNGGDHGNLAPSGRVRPDRPRGSRLLSCAGRAALPGPAATPFRWTGSRPCRTRWRRTSRPPAA